MPQRNARLIGGVYRTGQLITADGMLATYTAYNRNTNDVVGLFVIEAQSPEQIQVAQHLLLVLDKRRRVRSPHVIRVYDWGIDDNRIYIATDPPRGVTLQHIFDHEDIDILRAIDLTGQLAAGLKVLHEQGIAGLDLRPRLITVDTIGVTDRVQIDDIGLRSLLLAFGYISSQRNDDIGCLDPCYAPPECIHGGQIGPWSDIYQAGLLLFASVTGRLPFVGSTPAETGILQGTRPVPPMSRYKRATPPVLQNLVERALEKDPAKRFANADAFMSALDAVASPPSNEEHENNTDSITPPPSSISLTTEIPYLHDDITKRATHIERSSSIPQAGTERPIPNVPTEEGVYAYLCCEINGGELQRFPIMQRSVIVGRLDPKRGISPDVDLTPLDPTMTISRQHVRIRFEETFFYIEDLKSRNKTRLGELILTPLKAELLQHGDSIQFGTVRMTFEIPGMRKVPEFKNRPRHC